MLRLSASCLGGLAATCLFVSTCGWPAPLHFYTWREDTAKALPGTSAMIWSHMNYPPGKTPIGMPFRTAEPPEFAARELIRALKSRAPEDRVGRHIRFGPRRQPDLRIFGSGK